MILIIIGKSSKTFLLLFPQIMQFLLQLFVDVSAKLHLFLKFQRLGLHYFILFRQSFELICLLNQFRGYTAPSLLEQFIFLLAHQILNTLLLFYQSQETFLKLFGFIIKSDTRHGSKILLVAFLAKESSCLIFQFSFSDKTFFASIISAYPAPKFMIAQLFEAHVAETAFFLLLFQFFDLAVEYPQQFFRLGYGILPFIGLFKCEKLNKVLFKVADLVNGKYFSIYIFLTISDQAPLVLIYHVMIKDNQ